MQLLDWTLVETMLQPVHKRALESKRGGGGSPAIESKSTSVSLPSCPCSLFHRCSLRL